MFLLQIYKLNILLAKNIIPKGRCVYLEQNVNLVETPAVESKPQKFKICGTADFAKMAKIKKKYKFLKTLVRYGIQNLLRHPVKLRQFCRFETKKMLEINRMMTKVASRFD